MRAIINLLKKELLVMFVSPMAYCVVTGFLVISGFLFFSYLGTYNDVAAKFLSTGGIGGESVTINEWVIARYYHTLVFVMIFVVPLLTMRTFPEERKRSTFEFLITTPLSVRQIVFAKFLSVAVVVLLMLSVAYLLPLFICYFTDMNPETEPMWVGFLGVALCGLMYAAIALIPACVTENQIVAGLFGSLILLLLYVIFSPAASLGDSAQAILRYLSPGWQVHEFIQGVFTLKGVIYFVSTTFLGLFISQRVLIRER